MIKAEIQSHWRRTHRSQNGPQSSSTSRLKLSKQIRFPPLVSQCLPHTADQHPTSSCRPTKCKALFCAGGTGDPGTPIRSGNLPTPHRRGREHGRPHHHNRRFPPSHTAQPQDPGMSHGAPDRCTFLNVTTARAALVMGVIAPICTEVRVSWKVHSPTAVQ